MSVMRTVVAGLLAIGLPLSGIASAQEAPPAAPAVAAKETAPDDASKSLEKIFPLADSPDAGRELIVKVFALIEGLQRIQDLTREKLESQLGVRFIAKTDGHAPLPAKADFTWNQRLTQDWWMVGMNLERANDHGRPELSLLFLNLKNRGAAMTPICADLHEFAPPMVKRYGYAGRPIGTDVKHIRYLEYARPDNADSPVVELYPAAELRETPMQGKTCIRQITIH